MGSMESVYMPLPIKVGESGCGVVVCVLFAVYLVRMPYKMQLVNGYSEFEWKVLGKWRTECIFVRYISKGETNYYFRGDDFGLRGNAILCTTK